MKEMTISEYAKLKGLTRQAVHWQIKNGKLKACKKFGIWIIKIKEK